MSRQENKGNWTSLVKGGATFLKFVNDNTEKIEEKKGILSSEKSKIVAEMLGTIGELHWVVGALSIVAYLMEKCHQVCANKAEAVQLLKNLVDLATTLVELRERDVLPEGNEKLKNAVVGIVQGSMMCFSQIYCENISSFLKTSVDSKSLKDMSERLSHLYQDLDLAISTKNAERQLEMAERQSEMAERQSEMATHQSIILPVPKPFYPKDAGKQKFWFLSTGSPTNNCRLFLGSMLGSIQNCPLSHHDVVLSVEIYKPNALSWNIQTLYSIPGATTSRFVYVMTSFRNCTVNLRNCTVNLQNCVCHLPKPNIALGNMQH